MSGHYDGLTALEYTLGVKEQGDIVYALPSISKEAMDVIEELLYTQFYSVTSVSPERLVVNNIKGCLLESIKRKLLVLP